MKSNHTIQTNGAAIRVTENGAGEPALVFLHYWGGSARTWDGVIVRLGERVHSVVVNQRGWGGSDSSDGHYELTDMADDVERLVQKVDLRRYVLVGHSMGGKVSQIVAKRRPPGLAGLLLVAPAPPTPMPVPEAQRAAMLESYQSREGVNQALSALAGPTLPESLREQVIEDTLRGAPEAKTAWTQRGMVEDISDGLQGVTIPVTVVIGTLDQVEHEGALREAFGRFLPQTTFRVLDGIGHLSPLEDPDTLARACEEFLRDL